VGEEENGGSGEAGKWGRGEWETEGLRD